MDVVILGIIVFLTAIATLVTLSLAGWFYYNGDLLRAIFWMLGAVLSATICTGMGSVHV